jgi:acylphosphatase
MAAVRLMVRGRVQGVGFRQFVAEEAQAHGLRGWVRNRRDGAVEALVVGSEDTIAVFSEVVQRGPGSAAVEQLVAEKADEKELSLRRPGEAFSILPTA